MAPFVVDADDRGAVRLHAGHQPFLDGGVGPAGRRGAGGVSGTPGLKTSAASFPQSIWRRSAVGMPAWLASSTLSGLSSNATTSAPPASSALALARPDPASPNSATFRPAKQ